MRQWAVLGQQGAGQTHGAEGQEIWKLFGGTGRPWKDFKRGVTQSLPTAAGITLTVYIPITGCDRATNWGFLKLLFYVRCS